MSNTHTDHPADDAPTPLQLAIRARALDTLENARRQPRPTLKRKLMTGMMVLITLVILTVAIDFSVRIMHHILTVWYGEQTAPQIKPPPRLDPNQPFYISVDPPSEVQSSAHSTVTEPVH